MRWLIVEDALRDREGHWYEYVDTFRRGLHALGDEVTILADASAESFIRDELGALRVLPPSVWHRMNDDAHRLTRYARVPAHATRTTLAVGKHLAQSPDYDVVFVPTVLVHHLAGWVPLIQTLLRSRSTKIILFFPNAPVRLGPERRPTWVPSPTSRWLARMLRSLAPAVREGRVVLGAETAPMQAALTQLVGVPFTYFPHPVELAPLVAAEKHAPILMGAYGGERTEKGTDVLLRAIAAYSKRFPAGRVRFAVQCLRDFAAERRELPRDGRVEIIDHFFATGQYARRLAATDVMLLPYRTASYALRVSRVAIEAMVHGIPAIATEGTTLADQGARFGAFLPCDDGDVESLVSAIELAERTFANLSQRAALRASIARDHFSVRRFREVLVGPSNEGLHVTH